MINLQMIPISLVTILRHLFLLTRSRRRLHILYMPPVYCSFHIVFSDLTPITRLLKMELFASDQKTEDIMNLIMSGKPVVMSRIECNKI